MDLSVVIVSYNVSEKLKQNLKALLASQTKYKFEVLVVDNASSDDSLAMLESNFPTVKVIANQENLGFARANNQAIAESVGRFVLLLNPDMQVDPDTIEKAMTWAGSNQQADVIGCNLLDGQGKTIKQVRSFPALFDQAAIILKIPHIFPQVLNKYLNINFDYSKESQVESIRGSFFLIKRASFLKYLPSDRLARGEFLDNRFFIWFEEVDFCKTVVEGGGQIWYTPVAQCTDYVGQSFSQLPALTKQKYFRDSMLKYFSKWHSRAEVLLLTLCWKIGMFLSWTLVKLNVLSKHKT